VLSLPTAGGVVIDLSNGERLTITVPPQRFDSKRTGDTAVSLGVGASFLLTAAAVPEPSTAHLMVGALFGFVLAAKRCNRN
jgi:hypothetical protein